MLQCELLTSSTYYAPPEAYEKGGRSEGTVAERNRVCIQTKYVNASRDERKVYGVGTFDQEGATG